MPLQQHSAAECFLTLTTELAAKATIQDFVFVPDVTSQTGRGGEGALTLVTRKLLQSLAMLFSHMGNVIFPVWVACVARRTLPP